MLQFILGVLFASLLHLVWGLLRRKPDLQAGVNRGGGGGEEHANDRQQNQQPLQQQQDALMQGGMQPEAGAADSKQSPRDPIRRSLSADAAQSIRSKPLPVVGITQPVNVPPHDGGEDGQEEEGEGSLRPWAGSLDGGGRLYSPGRTSSQQIEAAIPGQLQQRQQQLQQHQQQQQQQQRVILRRSGRWLIRWESRPSRLSLQVSKA
ncbi:hypothetical protein DUNSADRAFT_12013 [Dunaliella salina]|uniref:Encoded protein n=1 Tax=Dunaliella salina TaxID=3046 RepID=A0ABQ7GC43_DUNSA|nr:hypothetical protein DUNSADRAFT_12013 [Dunaliella salina]|eukprot:KAF5832174.1 hypothetical protein DUNSADRAFT_12013 [Dunaliella salina]